MRKTALLLSVATLALVANPAAAQDAQATNTTTETTTQDAQVASEATAPGDTAADAQADAAQGDIIVTATRRSERLSNVPIAVSAVGQEALQNSGATDIRALTQLAPSLLVSSTGSESNASARIRGIGTVGDNPGLESSVATFIDGVYRSRTGSGLNDLGEVDRIEVLRGPQGTLSGRNASAGTISVITKAPDLNNFGGYAEGSYGNFDAIRFAGAITGPISQTLGFRIDGIYAKRDGYYYDVVNKTDYNDRNRFFGRAQLLWEPSSDLRVRLIGDYSRRDEKCCGAVYTDIREKLDPTPGVPGDFTINPAGNRIVDIMTGLGAVFPSAGNPYNRRIANSPGRAYSNITKDYGGSAQVDYNLGGASLTSITAYREYKAGGASDIDYGSLDIGYRADDGNNYRRFKTFTQELRLNGEAFGGKLDWLVGGYYSNERLQVVDNLKFGTQYGQFAACRVVSGLPAVIPGVAQSSYRDLTAPGCLSATGRAAVTGIFGAAAPLIIGNLQRLSTLNNLGSNRDVYNQTSNNFAFFTHNIFKLTDRLSITAGLRYTHEKKDFDANFQNNNTICPALQAGTAQGGLGGLLANPALAATAAGIITLGCTGNSSTALNAVKLDDGIKEGEFTGTGVLSWKPVDALLTYASYSRGYKAGGFNLDRSDLGPAFLGSTLATPNATRLRFDAETVDAFEIGFKYSSRPFTFNAAAFRQQFSNFQLNTFNGTNFVVQNIQSCKAGLNGGDTDNSATTGACPNGDTTHGVVSQGVELEAGFYPARNFSVAMGYTFSDTKFRKNLVGSASGEALDPALFLLAGKQLSNAPRNVVTSSATWTPDIGSSGLSALFYVDGRLASDYNTGSDLFVEKAQDAFVVVNARLGLRGADKRWSLEVWAQNLFDTDYQQVGFNAPFQGAGNIDQTKAFGISPANQLFSAYLAEPRTYGLTVRTRF